MTNLNDRPGTPGEPQSDPAVRRFSAWAEAWSMALNSDSPTEAEQSSATLGDAMVSAAAQACWICFAAFVRYSDAVAEALVRYEANLRQATPDPAQEGGGSSSSQSSALVDETRALLRRVGDAANLEARRVQHELEKIGESIARAAAASESASANHQHVRRHEVKA